MAWERRRATFAAAFTVPQSPRHARPPPDSPADLLLGAGGHASPSSPTLHLRVGPCQRRCARSPLRPCTRRATRSHAAAAHRARRAASRPRGRRAATSTVANTCRGSPATGCSPSRPTSACYSPRARSAASRPASRRPRAACVAETSPLAVRGVLGAGFNVGITNGILAAIGLRVRYDLTTDAAGWWRLWRCSRPRCSSSPALDGARARPARRRRAARFQFSKRGAALPCPPPTALARRPPQAARRRFGRAKGQALASI